MEKVNLAVAVVCLVQELLWEGSVDTHLARQRCSNSIRKRSLDIAVKLCRARLVLERERKSIPQLNCPKLGKQESELAR